MCVYLNARADDVVSELVSVGSVRSTLDGVEDGPTHADDPEFSDIGLRELQVRCDLNVVRFQIPLKYAYLPKKTAAWPTMR